MAYVPDQGDIVWLDFNLSSGKEIMKRRPTFVISRKAFNNHTGLAIVAPITSTIRNTSMEVVMSNAQRPKGLCLCIN
jgi:mRNA-degrading endonuclease toxin of MazEF toxin-antitoxin module